MAETKELGEIAPFQQSPESDHLQRRGFSCRRCTYKTDRKNNLKRHMVAMHEVTSQKLECCGLRFLNKADLKAHNGKYHTDGYKCPACGQQFVRKALLERHFSVHTGEKKFACECGYRTSHKSNLERHYKTHFKDVPSNEAVSEQLSSINREFSTTNFGNERQRLSLRMSSSYSNYYTRARRLNLPISGLRQSRGLSTSFPPNTTMLSEYFVHRINSSSSQKMYEIPTKGTSPQGASPKKRGFTVEELLRDDPDDSDDMNQNRDPNNEFPEFKERNKLQEGVNQMHNKPTKKFGEAGLFNNESQIFRSERPGLDVDMSERSIHRPHKPIVIRRPQPRRQVPPHIGLQWSKFMSSDAVIRTYRPQPTKPFQTTNLLSAFEPLSALSTTTMSAFSTASLEDVRGYEFASCKGAHLPTSLESQLFNFSPTIKSSSTSCFMPQYSLSRGMSSSSIQDPSSLVSSALSASLTFPNFSRSSPTSSTSKSPFSSPSSALSMSYSSTTSESDYPDDDVVSDAQSFKKITGEDVEFTPASSNSSEEIFSPGEDYVPKKWRQKKKAPLE